VPALLRFGAPSLVQQVLPSLLKGEKFIALAISEPNAGSDVAGMLCTAVKEVVDGVEMYRY